MTANRKRLSDMQRALRILAKGGKYSRRALFTDNSDAESKWQRRVLLRLEEEELLIAHRKRAKDPTPEFEAVDPTLFARFADANIVLAKWLFQAAAATEGALAMLEEASLEHASMEEPAAPPTPSTPVVPPAPLAVPTVPATLEIVEEGEAATEGTDKQILSSVLDTLVLCAENIVYIRKKIDRIEQHLSQELPKEFER